MITLMANVSENSKQVVVKFFLRANCTSFIISEYASRVQRTVSSCSSKVHPSSPSLTHHSSHRHQKKCRTLQQWHWLELSVWSVDLTTVLHSIDSLLYFQISILSEWIKYGSKFWFFSRTLGCQGWDLQRRGLAQWASTPSNQWSASMRLTDQKCTNYWKSHGALPFKENHAAFSTL